MRRDSCSAGDSSREPRRHGPVTPGERGNALWGGGGGGKIRTTITVVLTTLVALIACAAGQISPAAASNDRAYVSPALLQSATANPDQLFDVIVQGVKGKASSD